MKNKRDPEYEKAIATAKERLQDAKERGTNAIGDDAIAHLDNLMTPEEKSESDLRVSLMCALIEARNEQGISQKKLEELSGVRQPVIARMETGASIPQVSTLLKLLRPLGKTLAVVPLDKEFAEA